MDMNIREAYNQWAGQYDSNENKTRDLEAISLRETLKDFQVDNCLEIGCGTGKNSLWLMEHAHTLTSVDFSAEMLRQARQKITNRNVQFIEADILQPWTFTSPPYDLITFSLVLEHIKDLNTIFKQAATVVCSGGYVYVGELHPYKQYTGSKARFETADGVNVVTCFTHHVSDFIHAATNNGFELYYLQEYFDNDNGTMPRIVTFLFRKK